MSTGETPGHPLLSAEAGRVELLLGNEAIVRGAIEAGVGFACGYPGTPSSEITDAFARLSPALGIPFEYSVNEKIALESAYGACLAGARAIVAMKHLGLLYAGDPLSTMPYMGTTAGLVIVSGGDPSCLTSPNEQDQRHLGDFLHLPVLDPPTPQAALYATRFAFELSEASHLPVILRPTTRLCHTSAPVTFGGLDSEGTPRPTGFQRDPARLLPLPQNARRLRVEIEQRLATARALIETSTLFSRQGPAQGPRAILAAGVPAATSADVLAARGLTDTTPLLTLAAVHPLPESWLLTQLKGLRELLVIEELSPFIEDNLRAICHLHGIDLHITGKRTGHLPIYHEYEPPLLEAAILNFLKLPSPSTTLQAPTSPLTASTPPAPNTPPPLGGAGGGDNPTLPCTDLKPHDLPVRPPILCAACPHRSTFFTVRSVFGPETLYFNDIGCYTLGVGEPLGTGDALLCMGAGLTLAAGVARTTGQKTVGFIGDSTFFHSGMPALLNTVRQGADTLTVILDNEVTAMTGFQESPSTPVAALVQAGRARSAADIEAIVRALGVDHIETVDPEDLPTALAAFRRARETTGPCVVIARRPCPVSEGRVISAGGVAPAPNAPDAKQASAPLAPQPVTFAISEDLCRTCGRESAGHRCHQETLVPFEGAMAHARSLEVIQSPACAPSQAESCDSCTPGTLPTHRGERPATAPCASLCPLHLCIQGYAAHIASGDHAQALELILDGLPLPDSVCRVCHKPCEDSCVRGDLDEPVAINALKRFVMDWAARQESFPLPAQSTRCEADHGRRVAVLGAGPAGLAAAHGLRRRGYSVDLYDARDQAGGLLRHGIPAYRLPPEVLDRDVERILEMGVRFHGGQRLGADLDLDTLLAESDGVLLALGAGEGRRLEFPSLWAEAPAGTTGPLIVDALTWLESSNDGQAPLAPGHVLVVGGGNSAIDSARTALRRGAASATLVCLEERDEMPAIAEEVTEAQAEGVVILHRRRVRGLLQGSVEIIGVAPEVVGDLRPANFTDTAGSDETLPAEQLILAVGQVPDGDLLGSADVRVNDMYLAIDAHTGATSRDRLFAAGDLTGGDGTVTGSIAAGLRAAWGLDQALRGEAAAAALPPPPIPPQPTAPPPGRPGVERGDRHGPPGKRRHGAELGGRERLSSFKEVVSTLTEEEARAEAARCMICGLCGNCRPCLDLFGCPAFFMSGPAIEIDPNLCVSCGVCAEFCPNEAIYPVFASEEGTDTAGHREGVTP
ncbi:MAG: hypothetical protein CMJ98_13010 [Planctomycetes bacterium]|nr:hypothetical protein [Planctomycetota bacterium]